MGTLLLSFKLIRETKAETWLVRRVTSQGVLSGLLNMGTQFEI